MDWIKIDNAELLDIEVNKRYLVAVESWNGMKNDWYYLTANFYRAGDEVNLKGDELTVHSHRIPTTGFYYFIDVGRDQFSKIYHINNVHFYMPIEKPFMEADDILTIE